MTGTPEISVAVPSHDRPLRLRWLLNALEEQTLERARFEVVVVHDSRGPETAELLASHPLARAGVLRGFALPPGRGTISRQRNVGWRAARAPLVAFTDDDCRPPPGWLEHLLRAALAHPGAIVQGATRPDPDEIGLYQRSPLARSQTIDPPVPWAQTCNIAYPRHWLERVGGFDEGAVAVAGEDTDLAQRAIAAGARHVGAPEALTYHAVEPGGMIGRVRAAGRWESLPWLMRRHPHLRERFPLGVFWKETHAWLGPALAGLCLARRFPPAALAALPWMAVAAPHYGSSPRGRARALSELPARAVVDLAEMAALARGSVRHRSLFL